MNRGTASSMARRLSDPLDNRKNTSIQGFHLAFPGSAPVYRRPRPLFRLRAAPNGRKVMLAGTKNRRSQGDAPHRQANLRIIPVSLRRTTLASTGYASRQGERDGHFNCEDGKARAASQLK